MLEFLKKQRRQAGFREKLSFPEYAFSRTLVHFGLNELHIHVRHIGIVDVFSVIV